MNERVALGRQQAQIEREERREEERAWEGGKEGGRAYADRAMEGRRVGGGRSEMRRSV